jgi:hypothetical protein
MHSPFFLLLQHSIVLYDNPYNLISQAQIYLFRKVQSNRAGLYLMVFPPCGGMYSVKGLRARIMVAPALLGSRPLSHLDRTLQRPEGAPVHDGHPKVFMFFFTQHACTDRNILAEQLAENAAMRTAGSTGLPARRGSCIVLPPSVR